MPFLLLWVWPIVFENRIDLPKSYPKSADSDSFFYEAVIYIFAFKRTFSVNMYIKSGYFQIELPYIVFNDDAGNPVNLPLTNLLNVTYVKAERYLILHYE